MSRKKGTLFLEVHNETRLLLFMITRNIKLKNKIMTELFIFNRIPDTPAFNNDQLYKVMPGKKFIWDISTGNILTVRNRTRYKPLDWKRLTRHEDGKETIVIKILPTNNHISLEDLEILEKMGEITEQK